MRGRLAANVVLGLLLLAPLVGTAGTPVPPFPDDRVAVAGVTDIYDDVRRYLDGFRSRIGVEYHVAVVELSDPMDREGPAFGDTTGEYIDSVIEAWRPHLDLASHLTIVLALGNREVLVQPGWRWIEMGYSGAEVGRVTEASPFARFAQAGDYPQGIIELIRYIDDDLVERQEAQRRQAIEVEDAMVAAERQCDRVEMLLSAGAVGPATAVGQLEQAREALDRAGAAVERRTYQQASALAQEAQRLADAAEATIERTRALVVEVGQDLERLASETQLAANRLATADFESQEVAELLARAQSLHAEATEEARAENFEGAARLVQEGLQLVSAVEDAYVDALDQHRFRTRTLPFILIGLALVAGLIALLILWYRRRIWRLNATAAIESWEERLGRASKRLLTLETEHALILGWADLATRFEGATAGPVRKVATALDDLFLSYEAAQRLLAQAKAAAEGAGPLGRRGLLRATGLLDAGEVVVRTEQVTERRLFLPEEREVTRSASELMEEMDAEYGQLSARLGELEDRFRAVWDSLERSVAAQASIEERLEALAESELDLSVYADRQTALSTELADLRLVAQDDPLGATERASELERELGELHQRLLTVSEAVADASSTVRPQRDEAAARIERLRTKEGMRLIEPGFEPDVMLEHAGECLDRSLRAVETGDEEEARALIDDAAGTVDELLELIEASAASRAESREAIAALVTHSSELRDRVPAARTKLRELEKVHAEEALQPALDNANEADAALDFVASCLREATTASTVTEQRYLAAAELVDRAAATLDGVTELFEEIRAKAADLALQRTRAKQHAAATRNLLAPLDAVTEPPEPWVSGESLARLGSLQDLFAELTSAMQGERPNWYALAAESEGLEAMAADIGARLGAEKAAREAFLDRHPGVVEKRGDVRGMLEGSTDDRPPANEAFERGCEELAAAESLRDQEACSWEDALAHLETAEAELDEAKRLAVADFSRASEVRLAVARAERAVRKTDRGYGWGVTAALGGTRTELQRARQELAALDYEAALARAARAQSHALKAEQKALKLARKKAAEHVIASWSSGGAGRSSSRSSGSSWSSSKSWSSGSRSSGSSWTRGRSSSRSSFKSSFGSSSGRSSFGRSSSRSSFKRSSGRSKW